MTIDTLIKVLPPPAEPDEAFSGPWEPVEAELGLVLPQDYKDFVGLYGAGYFMEFVSVYVPRTKNPYTRLEYAVRVVCENLPLDSFLDEPPYTFWPTPGGLLPFGRTDDGDDLFWLTRGAPEDWKVVVMDDGLRRFETLDCDLTDFLAGLITGEVQPEQLADLLPCERLFTPNSAWPEP